MKMKNVLKRKNISIAFMAVVAVLASCSKSNDNAINSTDAQNVNSESVSSSTTTEAADMSSTVVNNQTDTQLSGARVAATQIDWVGLDGRLKGAIITIAPCCGSTFAVPQGTITIDFGTGQTDAHGVTRQGKIIISYYGRRFMTGSHRTISFNGYSRTKNSNTITFDNAMTYTITNVTADSTSNPLQFHHVLANGKLTFSVDNTTELRTADFVVSWDKVALTYTHLAKTSNVAHSAAGTTRKGVNYTMDITKDLVHKLSCLASDVTIAVSGTKVFTVGDGTTAVSYTIDYGNGDCDNTITVTKNGKTQTITVNSNGD